MISKESLVDIINKHNDPNDDTCIFNIQSTSATNFFTGRMIGNIKIEGEDIVFMEFDNTEEELYTIRTGLDNIDVVKYKMKPKMTTLIIQINKYIDELKEEKFIYDDETLSTLLTELKGVSVDADMTATKGKFSTLQEAVATIRRTRLGIIERLKGFEDTRNKFGKEFGYTETEYVFEDLTKLLDEQSARLTTNTALTTKIDGVQTRYETLNNLFTLSLTNVKVRDEIIKNLDLKVSIDEITEGSDTEDQVTEDQVAEGAVTGDQVAEGAVTGGTVAEGPVTKDPATGVTDTKEPVTEDQVTEDQVTEDQVTGVTDTKDPATGVTDTKESVTGGPVTEDQVTGDQVTGVTDTKDPSTGVTDTKEPVTGGPVTEDQVTGVTDTKDQVTGGTVTKDPVTEGSATEDQVTGETVTEDQVTELIDESKFARGFLKNDGTGQIHQPSNVDKELTSDFIRITSNSVYIFKYSISLPNGKNAWAVWQFYDSNKQPVGGLRGYGRVNDSSGNWSKTSEIIPTDNAEYIRLSFSSFGNGHISFKRGLNPNEVPMYVQDTFGIRSTTSPKQPDTEGPVTEDPVTK